MRKFGILLCAVVACVVLVSGCEEKKRRRERDSEEDVEMGVWGQLKERREQAMRNSSLNNLKMIGLCCHQYAQDNRERYPAPVARGNITGDSPNFVGGLELLATHEYLTDPGCFIAPFDKVHKVAACAGKLDPKVNSSYAYLGRGLVAGNYGSDTPLALEKPWILPKNSNSICVLFHDGSARIIEIPGVSKMSCRQALLAIFTKLGIYPEAAYPPKEVLDNLLRQADMADARKQ